jgi:3D (Asp-Asp-Asp) domain-containing protein
MSRTQLVIFAVCAASLTAAAEPGHRGRAGRARHTVRLTATAYCDHGETRSGAYTRPGTVGTDPRVLPIGSVIRIRTPQYAGTYTALDTGAAVKGHDVDIFVPNCAEARKFGKRAVVAEVLRVGPAAPEAGAAKNR